MKTIAELAREAGIRDCTCDGRKGCLERLVELVRVDAIADEREACAKVCDEQAERSKAAMERAKRTTDHAVYRAGAQTAEWNAASIRARRNT